MPELSSATADFAQTLGDLSLSDVGKQLSQSLGSLAEVERRSQELQTTQAQQDAVILMSTGNLEYLFQPFHGFESQSVAADEYARLVSSVKAS